MKYLSCPFLVLLSSCEDKVTGICGVEEPSCEYITNIVDCDTIVSCSYMGNQAYYRALKTGDVVCCDGDLHKCTREAIDLFCDFD